MKVIIFCMSLMLSIFAMSAPADILKKADEYRNPSQSYSMDITVKDDGKQTQFEVFLKGSDKTVIVTKSPAKDRGRNMLMLDRDFHAYVPNLKRTMRLSLAQKLSGQVANGDIARTRWAGDYEATVEKTTGGETQLLLKAKAKNLTYEWIRLWVETETAKPLRAEYLALNGTTLLKRAYFESYKDLAGRLRPSMIRIENPDKKVSLIEITAMKTQNLEDSFFTVRHMESLK